MKFLTIAVLFSLCSSVSAQDGEMFAKAKEHSLSNIDKRIGYLNELKSCVSGATNKEGMQACRKTHRTQMDALKLSNAAWRDSMKAEKQTKRSDKKKK